MSARKNQNRTIQLVAAISLNGKIADQEGEFEQYSSPEDYDWLHAKIRESDALVMGRKTYEQHVATREHKPTILLTRNVKGFKPSEDERQLYLFNDDREEFLNLCNLLQFQTITVLGGAEVYHWALEQKLVTDCFLAVEPYLIPSGKNILADLGQIEKHSWKLKSLERLNEQGSHLIHYSVA